MSHAIKGTAKLVQDIRDLVNVQGANRITIILDDAAALRLARVLDESAGIHDFAARRVTGAVCAPGQGGD